MPECLNHICKLFADDSKIIAIIKNGNDKLSLQEDLNTLANWAYDWRMKFNYDKCKTMTLGNKLYDVSLPFSLHDKNKNINHTLQASNSERDLGVQITNNLKWTEQTRLAVTKATQVLAMLRKSFKFWNPTITRRLYTTFIRPHLEYAACVWNPSAKKDIKALERVQQRVTKLPVCLRDLSYEERLKQLNLTTLEDRRERGDAIQLFKINIGINNINWYHPVGQPSRGNLEGPVTGVRGLDHRMSSQLTNVRAREKFFSNRVVSIWNNSPSLIWKSKSVNGFKNSYDKFSKNKATMSESLRRQAPAIE